MSSSQSDGHPASFSSSVLSEHSSQLAATQQVLQDGFEALDRSHILSSSSSSSSNSQSVSRANVTRASQYTTLGAPYAACPLITANLHLPVPTPVHHFFPGELLDMNVHPYPFRPRAGGRLQRTHQQQESSSEEHEDDDRPFVYKKRHSLGNGQIDRLVQQNRTTTQDDALEDRIHWLTKGYYVVREEDDERSV
jgi:hypothetical protein